ncbi:MAG: phosphate regulon transcriptional regulator PhoB [Gammaproteobacteria bacterium]|nr:phosphate regulon transcriptional regulator PhoB [Gammaproteobacteria bacterium]MDD9959352.1 phosphate regulon transcriptional regulator PhoB [Gammaproteobacteria bacterium]
MSASTILVVDDEPAIRDMVGVSLELAGFNFLTASNARDAHAAIIDNCPDLVLLDWMLPGGSGIELARRLRREDVTANIPIIMLTAKTTEDNKVQGLDEGVDDYVTKPFSPRELVARINSVLRRVKGKRGDSAIKVYDLELDPNSHRITIEDKPVEVGPTEFKLLRFLLQNQEKVFNRDQIQDAVWGANVYLQERTIDVHIRRLRKTLSSVKDTAIDYSKLIQTVRGTGYRFSIKPA